jgi:pyruvate kinase
MSSCLRLRAAVGDTILLSDGLIHLRCIETKRETKEIVCEVIHGGRLNSNQGINAPNVKLSTDCVTEKDIEDLKFGIENGIHLVFNTGFY